MITPKPVKLRLSNEISPVAMSQMLNNSIPRFLIIFIERLLRRTDSYEVSSYLTESRLSGGRLARQPHNTCPY